MGVDVDGLHPLARDHDLAAPAVGVIVAVAVLGGGRGEGAVGEGDAGLIAHGSVILSGRCGRNR